MYHAWFSKIQSVALNQGPFLNHIDKTHINKTHINKAHINKTHINKTHSDGINTGIAFVYLNKDGKEIVCTEVTKDKKSFQPNAEYLGMVVKWHKTIKIEN